MDFFSHLLKTPDDPILHLVEQYRQDPRKEKVDLSVGVYFNDEGKLLNFESVSRAQKVVAKYYYNLPTTEQLPPLDLTSKEVPPPGMTVAYLPASGYAAFNLAVRDLVFPSTLKARQEGRIVTMESVAGSGGLRICADFLYKLGKKRVFISDPTWSNHFALFAASGLETQTYRYCTPNSRRLTIEDCLADLEKLTADDVILFHGSCHNPSGYDFTASQWEEVLKLVKAKGAFPVFDFAYQGFGDGFNEDAKGLHLATEIFDEALAITSYSKNFGLYSERIGAVHILAATEEQANIACSNLQDSANNFYVAPGANGAYLVATILTNPELKELWLEEVAQVRNRIHKLRSQFAYAMKERGVDFDFVLDQKGMFSYTGLTSEQVTLLREKFAIYMVENGRMNIVGLNDSNIDYVADAFVTVLKG